MFCNSNVINKFIYFGLLAHLHHLIEKLAYGAKFKTAVFQSCEYF